MVEIEERRGAPDLSAEVLPQILRVNAAHTDRYQPGGIHVLETHNELHVEEQVALTAQEILSYRPVDRLRIFVEVADDENTKRIYRETLETLIAAPEERLEEFEGRSITGATGEEELQELRSSFARIRNLRAIRDEFLVDIEVHPVDRNVDEENLIGASLTLSAAILGTQVEVIHRGAAEIARSPSQLLGNAIYEDIVRLGRDAAGREAEVQDQLAEQGFGRDPRSLDVLITGAVHTGIAHDPNKVPIEGRLFSILPVESYAAFGVAPENVLGAISGAVLSRRVRFGRTIDGEDAINSFWYYCAVSFLREELTGIPPVAEDPFRLLRDDAGLRILATRLIEIIPRDRRVQDFIATIDGASGPDLRLTVAELGERALQRLLEAHSDWAPADAASNLSYFLDRTRR